MRLLVLTKHLLLGLLALTIFISCSASSNAQRYKKNGQEKAATTTAKNPSGDTAAKPKVKNERIVFNDPADSSDADDEFDEPPPVESPLDKSKLTINIDKFKDFNITLTPREKILFEAIKFLDTPYKYGGNSQKGIDCSAFTLQV